MHCITVDGMRPSPSPSVGEGQRVLGRGKHHVNRTLQPGGVGHMIMLGVSGSAQEQHKEWDTWPNHW